MSLLFPFRLPVPSFAPMPLPPPEDLRPWFQTLEDVGPSLDWKSFFGNDHPVELDIGSGRGLFLFNAATSHPERNFLGIELDYKEGRRAAKRLQKQQLPNARVLGGDVRVVLSSMIEPASVAVAHVYFPDPWWKKKHRRRRLFTDEFVGLLARVVKPGGEVHSWTDVADYFEVIQGLMDHSDLFTIEQAPEERLPEHDLDYQTSFERRKRQEGETISRGRWRRNS